MIATFVSENDVVCKGTIVRNRCVSGHALGRQPLDRFVAPFPGIDERLRLCPVFAALIIIDLEVIALRIERWVDVAEIDAFGRYLAAQDVEVVAVVEFVFWHARSPDTVWAELVEALPFLAG